MNVSAHEVEFARPVTGEDLARADFYALLSSLYYRAPDASLLAILARADELVAEDPQARLPATWNRLREAAAAVDPQVVRQEYDDLFIGVGRPEVMLYGSYYLAGFMMEKPLARLRQDLAELGLARRGDAAEPEDHVAALCDVMRWLVCDESSSPRSRAARQGEFFAHHLQPWYVMLCDAVEAAPAANFYRHAARFARAFLDVESESFNIEP